MSPKPGTGVFGARLLLGSALVLGTVLGGTSAAFASPNPGAPGDNGTVKIHSPSTPDEDNRNVPKVCDFKIVADHFDAVQEVSWKIVDKDRKWQDEAVLEGELTLDEEGSGSTDLLDVENGHYKLYWTFEGKKGSPKHKVFKVVCEESPEDPEPTPTEEPEPTPTEEPTTPPGEEETPGESPEPTAPDEPTTPEEPTAPEETEGTTDPTTGTDAPAADDGKAPDEEAAPSLPVTGAALTALVAAGAVAVAGGGAAVYFTRRRGSADAQE